MRACRSAVAEGTALRSACRRRKDSSHPAVARDASPARGSPAAAGPRAAPAPARFSSRKNVTERRAGRARSGSRARGARREGARGAGAAARKGGAARGRPPSAGEGCPARTPARAQGHRPPPPRAPGRGRAASLICRGCGGARGEERARRPRPPRPHRAARPAPPARAPPPPPRPGRRQAAGSCSPDAGGRASRAGGRRRAPPHAAAAAPGAEKWSTATLEERRFRSVSRTVAYLRAPDSLLRALRCSPGSAAAAASSRLLPPLPFRSRPGRSSASPLQNGAKRSSAAAPIEPPRTAPGGRQSAAWVRSAPCRPHGAARAPAALRGPRPCARAHAATRPRRRRGPAVRAPLSPLSPPLRLPDVCREPGRMVCMSLTFRVKVEHFKNSRNRVALLSYVSKIHINDFAPYLMTDLVVSKCHKIVFPTLRVPTLLNSPSFPILRNCLGCWCGEGHSSSNCNKTLHSFVLLSQLSLVEGETV